jgi:lysophospholipase L1-like esterase
MNVRSKFRQCAAVLLISCVIALLFDVTLRIFGYGNYIIFEPDRDLLWLPIASQQGVTKDHHRTITINSERFRYTSSIPLREDRTFRAFAFGDSVTMGWGVDDDSHYSAILEGLLNKDPALVGKNRVISAGVNAYPTFLCVRRYERVLQDGFDMNATILAYSSNHGFESLHAMTSEERDKFLRRVRWKSIVRRVALYNFFVEDLLAQAVYYQLRERLIPGSWDTNQVERSVRVEQYLSFLQQAKAVSDRHGVRLVLLLLGSIEQREQLDEYQQAMLGFAENERLPLVNMIEVLQDRDHSEIFADHNHPTERGHVAIARALLPTIRTIAKESRLTELSKADSTTWKN